ncbi:MAG TPA: LytTR family DNA-binding domain-containing protein [Rhodothermales bacterium]|nr:LytTR family DNA-binding domain-containing protein [Rhodothermales bacterium]
MLNVLLVDDEGPARKRLGKLLQPLVKEDRVRVVGEAENGEQALDMLEKEDVDLLFLDIHMPELDGFDVLERIPPDEHPVVVFTTAYDAYAVRAFEANAVDYLLKPISKERLAEAVARSERIQQTPQKQQVNEERLAKLLDWVEEQAAEKQPDVQPETPQTYLDQISIPYRDRILIVSVDRLVTAEISEGITRLFVEDEHHEGPRTRLRQHVVNYTLEQLEASLDPDDFMRVHRSSIVRLHAIKEMIPWFSGRYKLILTGDHEVIASRERSRTLKDRLML